MLIELLRIDQEHRWERGERRLLEQYLQDWPELIAQPAAIQELLDAECLTRFCLEDSPTRDELRQRFPQFAEAVDLDRLRGIALAEKGEASTAKGVNEATLITIKPPQFGDDNVDRSLRDRKEFESRSDSPTLDPTKSETSAVLAARRIGLLTGKQFGRYEVRRLVGTGGMGAVYEARDTQLDRIVALKIPRSELVNDPTVLQRFLNEARAAGAIRHPNICPIYDVGQLDGQHFITMPLVQGMSLAAWMEHRTVSLHEATELTRKLASALQAIHAAGIRHRDIKASNVMIDERGEPLLMDFGLARLAQTDQHLTQSGSLVGTPAYMAPEQIQLGASGGDERSDVYSLGVLLYQMLSGRLPFEGPMTRVLVDIATKEPPRLETLRPDVDAALADICRKAMSREPTTRYQTAAEFESALESWLQRSRHAPRDEPNVSTPSTARTTPNHQPTSTARSAPHAEREGYVQAPPRRIRRTLIAGAFFFILAGVIVIKISDRAELVIKSTDPGVEVSVRQLAQPEQDRTLTIGENSVRVHSGQVEVTVTGANADQYEVRNNGVVMKRFGREVVEITRRESVVGRPSQADSSRVETAQVGQGRPTYVAARRAWDDLDPKTIPESERVPGQPQELVAVLGAHRQRHWSLVYSAVIRADGKQAATCAGDGIRFWNLQTFEEQAYLNSTNTPGLPRGVPLSLLYTPDGRTLIVGHAKYQPGPTGPTVSEIDVSVLPPRLVRSLKLPNGWDDNTFVLEMSSSERFLSGRLPNGSGRGFIVERTETELKEVAEFPDVWRISFAPDEKTISVATRTGGPVRLFDFQDNKLTEQAVLTGSANEPEQPQSPFRDAKFSPDGRLLVIDGKSIPWFWDVRGAEPKPLFKLSRTGSFPSFSKDGQSLLVLNGSNGDGLHLWSLAQDQAKLVFSTYIYCNASPRHWANIGNDNILGSDLSPDGKFAITGHLNGTVRFLDVSSPDVTELHPVKPNPAVSFSYARPLRIGTDALGIMGQSCLKTCRMRGSGS